MEGPLCGVGLLSGFIVTRGEEEVNSNDASPDQRVTILCREVCSNCTIRRGQSPNCCSQFDTSSLS